MQPFLSGRITAPGDKGCRCAQTLANRLNYNENFFSNFLSNNHLAKSYPVSAAAKNVRVNGNVGMENDFDPSTLEAAGNTQSRVILCL